MTCNCLFGGAEMGWKGIWHGNFVFGTVGGWVVAFGDPRSGGREAPGAEPAHAENPTEAHGAERSRTTIPKGGAPSHHSKDWPNPGGLDKMLRIWPERDKRPGSKAPPILASFGVFFCPISMTLARSFPIWPVSEISAFSDLAKSQIRTDLARIWMSIFSA